jgi:hypothetical protein
MTAESGGTLILANTSIMYLTQSYGSLKPTMHSILYSLNLLTSFSYEPGQLGVISRDTCAPLSKHHTLVYTHTFRSSTAEPTTIIQPAENKQDV